MEADLARFTIQLTELRGEVRTLKSELDKLRTVVDELADGAAEEKRTLIGSSAQTKFSWISPLIRRIELLERKIGALPGRES